MKETFENLEGSEYFGAKGKEVSKQSKSSGR